MKELVAISLVLVVFFLVYLNVKAATSYADGDRRIPFWLPVATTTRQATTGKVAISPLTPAQAQSPSPCQQTDWYPSPGAAGQCNAPCGQQGTYTEIRDIKVPPTYGGTPCGPSTRTVSCTGPPCPVDCEIYGYRNTGPCSARCAAETWTIGTQPQATEVKTPAAYGGKACPPLTRTILCSVPPCPPPPPPPPPAPVDCQVSGWSNTGVCSAVCGQPGTQPVTRTITTPASNGGQACPPLSGTLPCTTRCKQWLVESPWVKLGRRAPDWNTTLFDTVYTPSDFGVLKDWWVLVFLDNKATLATQPSEIRVTFSNHAWGAAPYPTKIIIQDPNKINVTAFVVPTPTFSFGANQPISFGTSRGSVVTYFKYMINLQYVPK